MFVGGATTKRDSILISMELKREPCNALTFTHYYAFVCLHNKHKVTRFNNIPFWSVTKRGRGKFLYICFRKTYGIYMYRDDDIYIRKGSIVHPRL